MPRRSTSATTGGPPKAWTASSAAPRRSWASPALEIGVELMAEADGRAVAAKSQALCDTFIACVEARCTGLELRLATPRDPARRGAHVSFRHPQAWPVMQALIARGVIGDVRAPRHPALRLPRAVRPPRGRMAGGAGAARGARLRRLARPALPSPRGGDLSGRPRRRLANPCRIISVRRRDDAPPPTVCRRPTPRPHRRARSPSASFPTWSTGSARTPAPRWPTIG